jgi:type IV pilus assembly protein PilA
MKQSVRGFTFIELLIVTWIIMVLVAVAVPAYTDYVTRAQVAEGMLLALPVKDAVQRYYAQRGELPAHNRAANIAEPKQRFGQYVKNIVVSNGAIHITYHNSEALNDLVLSLHPAIHKNSGRLSRWVCGKQSLDNERWQVAGSDATSLPNNYLPSTCRW